MKSVLQISLFTVSALVFLYVVKTVYEKKLNIHYSIIWIIWSLSMVFISIFPNVVYFITRKLGIVMPSNTVFLIMIFLLYCMVFYVFLIISKHSTEITTLNYEIASLKKELKELKENK